MHSDTITACDGLVWNGITYTMMEPIHLVQQICLVVIV